MKTRIICLFVVMLWCAASLYAQGASPNLSAPHVSQSQAQKEVTINQAVDVLDRAVAGTQSIAVTGGTLTLTTTQAQSAILNFTGALVSNQIVIVPAKSKLWTVINNTSGNYTLTLKTASGTGASILQGKSVNLLADASNVRSLTTYSDLVVTSPSTLTLTADSDNTGGVDQRVDFVEGSTAKASLVGNSLGLAQISPAARLDIGGNVLGSASNVFRFRTNDPGRADYNISYQSALNNQYTPSNPIWANTRDHVLQFGYNCGSNGKQVAGEHLFCMVNESSFTVGDGTGRTQDEFYFVYHSRDGSYYNRPFGITTDLDTNDSVAAFSNTSLGFSTNGGNPGTVIGDKVFQFNGGGSLDWTNPTTDPMLTRAGSTIMRTPATGELNILEGGSNDEKIRLFASDGYVGSDLRLLFGNGTGASERGLRLFSGYAQYTRVNEDASLSWQNIGNQQTEDSAGRVLVNTNPAGGSYLIFSNQNGADFQLSLPASPYSNGFTRLRSYGGFIFQTVNGNDRLKIDNSGLYLYDGSTLQPVTIGSADSCGTGYRCVRVPN